MTAGSMTDPGGKTRPVGKPFPVMSKQAEPIVLRRQRDRRVQLWLAISLLVDLAVLALFGLTGTIEGTAWLLYAGVSGTLLVVFVWWSGVASASASDAPRVLLDRVCRLLVAAMLVLFAWFYAPLTYYFLALLLLLLCFPHKRPPVLWKQSLVEAIVAGTPAGLVSAFHGPRAALPLGTPAERWLTCFTILTVVARASLVGYWSNSLRHSLSLLKERYRELSAMREAQVADRTAQLEQRNAELAETNRQLHAIAASVAHDFRQPIITVAGHAGRLRQQAADAGERNRLDRVLAAAHQMEQICEGMSRLIDVERAVLELEEVDASNLAEDIVRRLGERVPHRRAEVRVQPGMRVRADPRLLRSALEILVANAFEACAAAAEPQVAVNWRREGAMIALCVEDNGAGLGVGETADLFTPFVRLHSDPAFTGTGVNLPIARRIAQRHGGGLEPRARPDGGMRFVLTLPA